MGKATRKDCSIPAEEEKQRGGGSIEENKAKQVYMNWAHNLLVYRSVLRVRTGGCAGR
jgi:hypothetical protein